MAKKDRYTCAEYSQEMRLLGLKRRLDREDLSEEERRALQEEVKKLESDMEMD